jgi:hypothetical protein
MKTDLFSYVETCKKQNASQKGKTLAANDSWETIHHPRPASLGGTTRIRLKKSQHAVQGLLQSEYYNRPCIYGWERHYLTEDWQIELYDKWMTRKAKIAATLQSKAGKRKGGLAAKKAKVGIHNPEVRRMASIRGANVVNSRRFMCSETGFVSSAIGLTSYQRKRGIDTCNRQRVK